MRYGICIVKCGKRWKEEREGGEREEGGGRREDGGRRIEDKGRREGRK